MEPTNEQIIAAFWKAATIADTGDLEKILIYRTAMNPEFETIAVGIMKSAGALFAAVSDSAVAIDKAITEFDKSAATYNASLN